jgi:hypothetical protein
VGRPRSASLRSIEASLAIEKLPWHHSHRFAKVPMPVHQATPLIRCSRSGMQRGDVAALDAMATPRRQSLASAQPDFHPPDCGRWQRPLCQPSSPVDMRCMSTGLSCLWHPFRFLAGVFRRETCETLMGEPGYAAAVAAHFYAVCWPAVPAHQADHGRTVRLGRPRTLGRSAYV